jgi:hypothetical protein
MSKKEKYGFVYIWYDRKYKRYYIGCHWGTEDDGYICSSNWMRDSYKRRPEDFKRRILKTNLSKEQMFTEEQKYFDMIKPEEIRNKYYNLKLKNGKIWFAYPDQIKTIGQKISFSKKGKSTGPCSDETKQKISISNSGKIFSDEHKEKISKARIGIKHSEEWKQKTSELLKEQWASGVRKSNGPISEEHKQKISKKLKGRKLNQDQIESLKEINYKKYIIEYTDGSFLEIIGLKKFAQENKIPYVTLHKAFKSEISIPKYNIKNIKLINKT